jgi:hypothetical protein
VIGGDWRVIVLFVEYAILWGRRGVIDRGGSNYKSTLMLRISHCGEGGEQPSERGPWSISS